jgi:hypothetical protein
MNLPMPKAMLDSEFEKFTKVMDSLMAVPYKELQKKLAQEKRQKAKRKQAKQLASRASTGSA